MRHDKVLDLCYGTIRRADKSYCKAPVGTSDTVCLVPLLLSSSTGSPQGRVLSPHVFVLYTNSCLTYYEKCS